VHHVKIQKKKWDSLTSRVLIRVDDKFDERVGRVPVQVMRVPRFLSSDLYARFGEDLRYGRRDFTEMSVIRVRIQKRHLWYNKIFALLLFTVVRFGICSHANNSRDVDYN